MYTEPLSFVVTVYSKYALPSEEGVILVSLPMFLFEQLKVFEIK